MENEAYFDGTELPFSSNSVVVQTADGLRYSMANATERQQCADANSVNFVNVVSAAVRSVVQNILITVGVFTFGAVGKTGPNGLLPEGDDPRVPFRVASLSKFCTPPLDFLGTTTTSTTATNYYYYHYYYFYTERSDRFMTICTALFRCSHLSSGLALVFRARPRDRRMACC